MKKRSITLIIATILATAYSIYLVLYFGIGIASSDSASEAVGSMIASALVTPHMIMFLVGAVFGWVGVFFRKAWGALTAAILYSVGTVLFMIYAMFGIPISILGFIGYALQNKINHKTKNINSNSNV